MLLSGFVMAQNSNWGTAFTFGKTLSSDGVKLIGSTATTLDSTDTLYTPRMDMGDEYLNGVYKVVFSGGSILDSPTTADSLFVDVRFYFKAQAQYGNWINLWDKIKVDTLYQLNISQTDSSWWGPANGRQYRLYKTDVAVFSVGTLKLSDYMGRYSQ